MSFTYIPAPTPTPGTPPDKIIPSTEWLNAHDGGRLIAVSITFAVLCAIFVVLRFVARRIQQTPFGLDDWIVYPALITNWATQATCIVIVPKGGVGTRTAYWVLTGQEYMTGEWAKHLLPVQVCYLLANLLSKLALLAIFLRILRDPISRRVTFALVAVVVATWVGETVAVFTECIPIEYQWDKSIPGGHCFDIVAFYAYLSVPNILTDVVLLILPIPTVWKLHTSTMQKVQLTFVFLTGSFGIVSSILRFTNFFTVNPLADPTYNSVILLTWTVIEPSMYLISACLPSLRPLLRKSKEVYSRHAGSHPATKHSNVPPGSHGQESLPSETSKTHRKPRPYWLSSLRGGGGTHTKSSFDKLVEDEPYPMQIIETNSVLVTHSPLSQQPPPPHAV